MFSVNNGVIKSKKGLPSAPLFFCDGRLSVKYGYNGVERSEYFMPFEKVSNNILFKQGLFDSFWCSIIKNGLRYIPSYDNVKVYPFGFTCEWLIERDKYLFGVYVVNQHLFYTIEGNADFDFCISFSESTQFIPAFNGDFESNDNGIKRIWKQWQYNENGLVGGFSENGDGVENIFNVALMSDGDFCVKKSLSNGRIDFKVKCNQKGFVGILFSASDIEKEKRDLKNNFYGLLEKQVLRYKNRVANLPKISTKYKSINDFFIIAPLYYESLKTVDQKGAIRAKSSRYYVWCWDTIISDIARFCWGDCAHTRDILEYFSRQWSDTYGLAHACTQTDVPASYMHISSQGVYVIMLENYVGLTGDTVALEKYYDYALRIYKKVIGAESKIPGLFSGSSISIDLVQCIKETGNDISCFNNSMAYAMLRAMETLAAMKGDAVTQKECVQLIENAEKNFFPTFFDEEKGFYVMSVDSLSLVQRKTYALCAGYHWDSDYHFDLLGRFAKNCGKFVKENALSQSSLRNVPVWDDCFDADANQLNATFANVDEVLLRLAKFNDIEKVNQKWIEKLGYWMSKITCPEGESNLYESRTPIASRWDGENGSWQAFALKKWYCDIVEVLCGLSFDGGGITFERPCFEYKLRNLRYRDKTINISVSGAGREIENILVNGQTLKGTLKIPEEMLRNKNEIIVVLGEKQDFSILRGTGIGIYDYVYEDGKISFTAKGYGLKYLYFTDNAKVYTNGKEIHLERLQDQGVAYIKMNLINGQSVCLVKEKY